MKIHRLRLINVKGIADRDVIFPNRGVIVIEGPNEAGKTSMLEALDLLLEEKDSSRKRHVLAARPVGRDVGTTIEAELSSGDYRLRYRKQWFKQPATELHVLTPKVEHLTGVPAHDRVVQILAETTDQVLWRALRFMQATPMTQVGLGGSRALAAALDAAALGGPRAVVAADEDASATSSPRGGDHDDGSLRVGDEGLVAAAEREHARYFTPGKGQPTGEYRAASDAEEGARHAERAAAASVAEVMDDVRRHESCTLETAHARAELDAAVTELGDVEATWAEVAGLLETHQAAEREALAAVRERDRATERDSDRRRQRDELASRGEAVAHLGAEVAQIAGDLTQEEERLRALVAERSAAAEAVVRWEEQTRTAEQAETAVRRAAEVDALRERCQRVAQAESQRRAAMAALSRLSVDEATVRALEKAATAVDLAEAQSDADSARLTIVGLADGLRVVVDGEDITLDKGVEHVRGLAEPFDVTVPGEVTFRLRPESAAGERAAGVERARLALTQALQAAGVAGVDEARDRWEERRRLQDCLTRATDRLADVLAGSTLPQLQDTLATLEQQIDPAMDAEGGAQPSAATQEQPGGATSAELRRELAAARETHGYVAARVEALRGAVEETRVAHTRADSLLGAARRELAAADERLRRLRGEESDGDLAGELAAASAHAAQTHDALRLLQGRLDDRDAEGTERLLAAARTRARVGAERVGRLRDERLAIEARLEHSGRQGRYDALESARGVLKHAERRLASVARRAEAARLLHETLQSHRSEATRRYVEPFAAAVQRLGAVVYGSGFAVEVDDSLVISARVLDGTRIDYEALSTGAKEQLAILTRLAVATLVDPADGVPVVIDDALGYTDPSRLRRMAAAFSHVGDAAQVILLTCTPGRYDGIVGAAIVRVTADCATPASHSAVS